MTFDTQRLVSILAGDQAQTCTRLALLGEAERLLRVDHPHVLRNRQDRANPRMAASTLLFCRWQARGRGQTATRAGAR